MSFRFEKLNVWQDARVFVKHIYTITKKLPSDERFSLVDQLRRAVVSVALNITEGSDRKSDVEFRRFLRISITSVEEVVTGLYIALDQKYITQKQFGELYQEANNLVARINSLVKSLSAQ